MTEDESSPHQGKGEYTMKKAIVAFALAFVLGMTCYAVEGNAQMGPGMTGRGIMGPGGYEGWYCPYCGQYMGGRGGYGMGPGIMHRGMMGPGMMGYGMGPWMMGRGMGPGMMGPGYWHHHGQGQGPLKEKDAKSIVQNYLKSTRNPNLKLGKIKEVENGYEAEIVTKENSLVDKVLVNKYSGWMRSVY